MSSPSIHRVNDFSHIDAHGSSMQSPRERSHSAHSTRFVQCVNIFNRGSRKDRQRQSAEDNPNQRSAYRESLVRALIREEIIDPDLTTPAAAMATSVVGKTATATVSRRDDCATTSKRLRFRCGTHRRIHILNTMTSEDSTYVGITANAEDKSISIVEQTTADNVVQWLQNFCPDDVAPKVLAFCGPQTVARLSQTNKQFNRMIKKESTWQVLSEELYKWKKGDEIPLSWYDYYCTNPCVPIDYTTVHKALAMAREAVLLPSRRGTSSPPLLLPKQVRPVRILLRPGVHYLHHSVEVRAISGAILQIEAMEMPENVFVPSKGAAADDLDISSHTTEKAVSTKSRPPRVLRNYFSCVRPETVDDSLTEDQTDHVMVNTTDTEPSKTVSLVLRSRHHNEPVFRVFQGVLGIQNIEIHHNSHGTDIWSGNAAIQIQPPTGDNDLPLIVYPRPTVILDKVLICSRSGRGIVNIDGGSVTIRDSMVRDCAATGIYVGGPGGEAVVERTDVIRNGIGNRMSRRGVSRGHSGIYLEQGTARIIDSNVSNNTLTGISVVSPDNALITLRDSDLMSNGTFQLELPQLNTVSHQRSEVTKNKIADVGEGRTRSSFSSQNGEGVGLDVQQQMMPIR